MGMYSEICFNANLLITDELVVKTLEYMARKSPEPREQLLDTPKHPFFECDRWAVLFCCGSASFPGGTIWTFHYDKPLGCYHLSFRSNLKDYGNEINQFLDWICPYIEDRFDYHLGYTRYETDDEPTLIYKFDGKIHLASSRGLMDNATPLSTD